MTSSNNQPAGCRVYWSAPADRLALQTMTAGTTGSFTAPGLYWRTWSLDATTPAGARLTGTDSPALFEELAPGTFAHADIGACAPVVLQVDVLTVDRERREVTFAAQFELTCLDPRVPWPQVTRYDIVARGTEPGGTIDDIDGPLD